jgi:periplasmic divalent cation tolerance protein
MDHCYRYDDTDVPSVREPRLRPDVRHSVLGSGERTIRAMADLEVQYLQVQTTTDSRAEAMELSRAAVEARLAACAQVAGPVASMYWWDGGLERAEEWLVLLKLPVDRYDELAAFLTERHSYDEPEIIALPIVTGSATYLTWMREETRRADGASG